LRKHCRLAVLLGLVLMIACGRLLAQRTAREQLEHFAQGLNTLSASFEQRILGKDGALQEQSAGNVWLSQPDLMRWEYGGEFPEVVVADGSRIWIYDKVLEQVTVKPQSDLAANSPLSLLTDINKLDEQFEVREAGDLDELSLLELRAVDKESEFDRILLGMQHDELLLMVMEDAFGLRTEIRFSDLQRNQALDPKLFSFTPPDGVDVISGPAGDAAKP